MEIPIIIEGLQCSIHCGVTDLERQQPQPILIDLELQCANGRSAFTDSLFDTVDYGTVTQRIIDSTTDSQYYLLESLVQHLCQTLFQDFPITHLKAWVRKTHPPLDHISGSVGVRVSRSRAQCSTQNERNPDSVKPSPFLIDQYPRLSSGKILDVATGHGRHALFLMSLGFSVVGVDRDEQALAHAEKLARDVPTGQFTPRCLDLETDPEAPPDLGKDEFDGILVFFYLYRPLFPRILQALKPGGILLYETFLIDNHTIHHHPRNQSFCFQHNELLSLARDLRILHYAEGEHQGPETTTSHYTVQLVAQKA